MELKEWAKHYITFKDAIQKRIKSILETEFGYVVEEQNGEKTYYVINHIKEGLPHLEGLKEKKIYFITPNTQDNITQTIAEWETLKAHSKLTIIYANAKTNESWLLHPFTHANVSGEKSLTQGLQTLYEGIKAAD